MNNALYDPLEPHRFPKTHEFTIQECRALDVREVISFFSDDEYRNRDFARLKSSDLLLEARKCGAARRWFFLCPTCARPCEHLYLPPDEPGEAHAAVKPEPEEPIPGMLSPSIIAASEEEGGYYAVVARAIVRAQSARAQRPLPASEGLARLPYVPVGDWRCRECWNLNYASQRFGRTNSLRRTLPPRRVLSRRRRLIKRYVKQTEVA